MNIYGILMAAGLLPAYNKAKKKAEEAKAAMEAYAAVDAGLAVDTSMNLNSSTDSNYQDVVSKKLEGVTLTVVLRVGNVVGKFLTADCQVIFRNDSNTDYLISKVAASFRILGQPIQTYFPLSAMLSQELRAHSTEKVGLSGNTSLIFFLDEGKRDELRKAFVDAYNYQLYEEAKRTGIMTRLPAHNILGVSNGFTLKGIGTANISFRYNNIKGIGEPIQRDYEDLPLQIVYMGEAFTPNNKNIYDPLQGAYEYGLIEKKDE